MTAAEPRRRYVEEMRREGVLTRDDVARAFAVVPREQFVASGFHGRDGRRVDPGDPDFLEIVYRNDVLVTKIADGVAVSSSSQPSLMAIMIESLDLGPGTRVLEIGAGTGYNAALMAAVGARVTTVDVQPDVVERAAAALARVGLGAAVDLRLGDGYLGAPAGAPYDRVIVTVGLAGVSPEWLDQLAPDGFVLAPVGHAGNHPVLRVRPAGPDRAQAWGVCHAGFMSATGPLAARYPGAHPEPLRADELPAPTVRLPARWRPPLTLHRYHDLWFAAGAWDRRVTFSAGLFGGRDGVGGCVLLDETRRGGAGILADGAILAAGSAAGRHAAAAAALRDRWVRAGEPRVADWSSRLVPAGDPGQPILVPAGWRLRQPAAPDTGPGHRAGS